MCTRPRALPRHLGAAFTLIELLLAVALLSLLFGAVAFNFNSLRQGKSLDEGVSQFEALLRIARAQAAATGRPVVLALVAPTNSPGSPTDSNALALAVLTQPDPLRQPDLYRPLPSVQYLLADLADLIRLQIPTRRQDQSDRTERTERTDQTDQTDPSDLPDPRGPLLTFLPDGSCDAADFIVLSQDPEDHRRVHVHVDAVTGTIHRRSLSQDNADPDDLEEEPMDEEEDSAFPPTPDSNPTPPSNPGGTPPRGPAGP